MRLRVSRLGICFGAVVALWAVPVAAQAADVNVDGSGRLVITDGAGQTNNLVLTTVLRSVSGGDTFHYFVTDNATPPTTSEDNQCATPVGNTVECGPTMDAPTTLVGWTVNSGGGADTIRANSGGVTAAIDCGPGIDTVYIDENDPDPANCESVFVGPGNGLLKKDPTVRLDGVSKVTDTSATFAGVVNRNGTTKGVGFGFEYENALTGETLTAPGRLFTEFGVTPLFSEHAFTAPAFGLKPATAYYAYARATVGPRIIRTGKRPFITQPSGKQAAAGLNGNTVSATQTGFANADAGQQKTVNVPVTAPAAGTVQATVIANIKATNGKPWTVTTPAGAGGSQLGSFWTFGSPSLTPPTMTFYASSFVSQDLGYFGGFNTRVGPYGTITTGLGGSCGFQSSMFTASSGYASLSPYGFCSDAGSPPVIDNGPQADNAKAKKKKRAKRRRHKASGIYVVIAYGKKTVGKKGQTTVKLKPTKYGKRLMKALRKQVAKRRKQGKARRKLVLDMGVHFKKKHKRKYSRAQGGQFQIPKPAGP